jgi:hypothetical protein
MIYRGVDIKPMATHLMWGAFLPAAECALLCPPHSVYALQWRDHIVATESHALELALLLAAAEIDRRAPVASAMSTVAAQQA